MERGGTSLFFAVVYQGCFIITSGGENVLAADRSLQMTCSEIQDPLPHDDPGYIVNHVIPISCFTSILKHVAL